MNLEFLQKLLETPSPSGNEELGLEVWKSELKDLPKYYSDKSGNYAVSVGTGEKKILLSGHIDEICMSIQRITDNGFLVLANMGGIDRKVLPGSEVLLLSDTGQIIKGVVHKNPIHIEYGDEKLKNKVLDIDELRVDVGAETAEDIKNLGLRIGSPVVHGRIIDLKFGQNKLHGNSLDDKAGIFVVAEIMKRLNSDNGDWRKMYTVIGLACIGEESGLLGAHRAAHEINPDISIDLDVTHASDTGQFDINKYGEVKLGKGPVITWGQDKSKRLNQILKTCGETQDGVARIGGTNTKEFFLESKDAETTLLSLPLLSMHTPIETMDYRDILEAIDILYKAITEYKL